MSDSNRADKIYVTGEKAVKEMEESRERYLQVLLNTASNPEQFRQSLLTI